MQVWPKNDELAQQTSTLKRCFKLEMGSIHDPTILVSIFFFLEIQCNLDLEESSIDQNMSTMLCWLNPLNQMKIPK